MRPLPSNGLQLTVSDHNGDTSVFLHPSGDHIAIRYVPGKNGAEYEAPLPHGSWAWDRAINRAMRGSVFL